MVDSGAGGGPDYIRGVLLQRATLFESMPAFAKTMSTDQNNLKVPVGF